MDLSPVPGELARFNWVKVSNTKTVRQLIDYLVHNYESNVITPIQFFPELLGVIIQNDQNIDRYLRPILSRTNDTEMDKALLIDVKNCLFFRKGKKIISVNGASPEGTLQMVGLVPDGITVEKHVMMLYVEMLVEVLHTELHDLLHPKTKDMQEMLDGLRLFFEQKKRLEDLAYQYVKETRGKKRTNQSMAYLSLLLA